MAVLVPPGAAAGSALRFARATRSGGFAALPRVRADEAAATVLDDLRGDR